MPCPLSCHLGNNHYFDADKKRGDGANAVAAAAGAITVRVLEQSTEPTVSCAGSTNAASIPV